MKMASVALHSLASLEGLPPDDPARCVLRLDRGHRVHDGAAVRGSCGQGGDALDRAGAAEAHPERFAVSRNGEQGRVAAGLHVPLDRSGNRINGEYLVAVHRCRRRNGRINQVPMRIEF